MRISLKKLILENFMCYAHKEVVFGNNTKIAASNGKGKSSITNAYMWLLFNCDYQLADNPPIRRMVDGNVVCPIWLDDAESLDSANQQNAVDMVDGQIIMLAVNDNEELEVM